jgi:hypothetical protein
MSGAAAETRKKRTQTRGDAWLQRPADVPRNAPTPKYGWLVQQAMIQSDGIIYRTMESLKPAILANGQRVLTNASITRIARATAAFTHDGHPMPRRTVAHRLAAMRRRKIITVWEARAVTTPIGTSWRLTPFGEVLEAWKQDPEIFTPKNRAFYVQGKGRRFVSPEQATAWHLNAEIAEKNPAAQATAVFIPETPAAAAPKAQLPRLSPQELIEADIEVVHRAILAEGVPATPAMAAGILAAARAIEPTIGADSVAELVRQMAIGRYEKARAKRDPRPVLTIGWFQTGLAAAVHLWKHNRDEAQRATTRRA